MKKCKLIAVDLDGTLLKNDKTISDYTIKTINDLIAEGYLIVPSTARALTHLPQCLSETNIRYYICTNGSTVYDKKEDKILFSHKVSSDLVKQIIAEVTHIKKTITLIHDGIVYSETSICDFFKFLNVPDEIIKRIVDNRTLVDDINEVLCKIDNVEKLHFNALPDQKEELRAIVSKYDVNVTSSGKDNLEVTNPLASKGLSVLELCDYLNIDHSEFMAIGDNLNDLSLFEKASVKIAMKNSNPLILDQVDFITEYTNDEDGVAKFLNKHFN